MPSFKTTGVNSGSIVAEKMIGEDGEGEGLAVVEAAFGHQTPLEFKEKLNRGRTRTPPPPKWRNSMS